MVAVAVILAYLILKPENCSFPSFAVAAAAAVTRLSGSFFTSAFVFLLALNLIRSFMKVLV